MDACLTLVDSVDESLGQTLLDTILPYWHKDISRNETDVVLVSLGLVAPTNVRNSIAAHFRENENFVHLAILNEEISEDIVKTSIGKILKAITPIRSSEGSISFSGIRARSINNFNNYISPSFSDFVIDGLLNVVRNPDGFSTQKSEAFLTIRWLPDAVLKAQANEITEFLLETAKGNYTGTDISGFMAWFGSNDEIYRNSLYALGHLYKFVNDSLREQILENIISLGNNESSTIRMGSVMAMRLIEGKKPFPSELVFTLIELLKDEDTRVRHWAASSAGHRIADDSIQGSAVEFIVRRLIKQAEEDEDAHARAGAAYGLRILLLESNILPEDLMNAVKAAHANSKNDVNYNVRRMATG